MILNLLAQRSRAIPPALLIVLAAALPPHVHPSLVPVVSCLAALAAVVAGGPGVGRRALRIGGLISIAALLNVLTSIQVLASVRLAAMATACALIALCGSRLGGEEEAAGGSILLAVVALTGTGLALDGLRQSLMGFGGVDPTALTEAMRARMASGRAVATLGLPAALGGWLAMSIPVTAAWIRGGSAAPVRRVVGALMIAVQGAGLMATRSSSSLVALAVAGGWVIWQRARQAPAARRRAVRGAALIACVAGIAGGALFLALRFAGPGAVDEGKGPFALRAGNWMVAARCVAAWPMLGTGIGNYGTAFPAFREWGMNESRHVHNSYLQMAAEGGVLLGLPVIGLAWCLARRLTRIARGTVRGALLSVACLAFLLHNLVDFTAYLPTTAILFALLAGMTVGGEGAAPREERRGVGRTARIGAALLLCLLAAWIGAADARRDEARDLADEGRAAEAIPLARTAMALNPIDPDARFLLSSLLLQDVKEGSPEGVAEAVHEARRACALDPRTPHRWQHLSRAYLAHHDPIAAYIALTRAVDLYPMRGQYRVERDAIAAQITARTEAAP